MKLLEYLCKRFTDEKPYQIQGRFLFIDGLRGIASLAVAGFHFYGGGPLYSPLSKILPALVGMLLEHGSLGVEIFFVLSGFVIAYSLRNTRVTLGFLGNFVLRRSLRLDPPYWATIALVIIVNYVSNFVLTDRTATLPGWGLIVAHIFYLQNILKLGNIVPVFWTLCLEVQFYLVFIILMGIAQRLSFARKYLPQWRSADLLLVFAPLVFISLDLNINTVSSHHQRLFVPYWHMFFMGVMVWWVLERKVANTWFWSYTGIIVMTLVITRNLETAVVLATGCSIYFVGKLDRLHNWLAAGWLQYFGRISYSLYLVHTVIGMRIITIGYRISGNSTGVSLVWFTLAFATSIAAAHLMYLFIEKPSIELSKRLKRS